ncbi:MAG: hypothetical protein ABI867_07535 [Kofleriaceae bacterium]
MTRWIAVLVVVGLASVAQAGNGKVDWSQYLEKPGDRVAVKTTPAAKSAKPAKKAAPKAKARPKPKATRKRR